MPVSRKLHENGELQRRVKQGLKLLEHCELCPRKCSVNRVNGEHGLCATGRQAQVASYGPHFGEEQPLVGTHGSGTIFLSSCNLRCCFCQNYDISHSADSGISVDGNGLAAIMLELQDRGCHNINFVTPSHVVPQILEALPFALEAGLHVPLIYNCSGYESQTALALLDGIVDIYMPDFKFWNGETAAKYADAEDYPEIARQAVRTMFKQVGDLQIDHQGVASKGLLIRHLLMPGGLDETENILQFIAQELSPTTYVNLMDQYRPCGRSRDYPELGRSISADDYRQAVTLAQNSGLVRLDERDLSKLLKNLGFF